MLAIIAAAIRLDSKGPIFFRQVRVGRDGEPFRIFKFRSMGVNAEEQKEGLRAFSDRRQNRQPVGKIGYRFESPQTVLRLGCIEG